VLNPHLWRVVLVILGLMLGGPFTDGAVSGEPSSFPIPLPPNAPPTYSADATEGWAVDVETQQPVEGVIVVAYWELKALWEGYPVGLMMVMEAVTDAKGRFSFPSWGPKPRLPVTGQLRSMEPELVAFKSGYARQYEPPEIPKKEHPQQILKFKKVPEDSKEYINGVSFIESQLRFAFFYNDCSWKKIPRMLITLDQEKTRLLRAVDKKYETVEHVGITHWNQSNNAVQKCGSMMDFLRSYLP